MGMGKRREPKPSSKTHQTITQLATSLDKCSSIITSPLSISISTHLLKKLHCRIITTGLSTHTYLHTKLLFSYASSLHISYAARLLSLPRRRRPPAAIYNAVAAAHSRLGLLPEAASVLRRMLRDGVAMTERTLPPLLRACALLSAPSGLPSQLHSALIVRRLSNSNSLIMAYSRCGLLLPARRLFDSMPERSAAAWSAMVSGSALNGDAAGGVGLFREMVEAGVEPDATAFTTVLTACARGGMVEEGCRCFEMMGRVGVRPGVEHYTCMVELVGRRAGRVEEAERLVTTAAAQAVVVDHGLWRALLAACASHGRLEVAHRVAHTLGLLVRDK